MSLPAHLTGLAVLTFAALQGFADQVSDSPITYFVVMLAAGADVLFPLIPSETIVVTAAVLASHGDLIIWLLIPATAIGAIIGDNIAYFVGAKLGDPFVNRIARSEESQKRLLWSQRAIHNHGATVIVAGRFIPGGRTVTTLAAGTLEMDWRKFIVADIVAASVWAVYISLLGYLGGATFRDNLWEPLVISVGVVFLVGGAIEGWRRLQRRRGKDILGDRISDSGVDT